MATVQKTSNTKASQFQKVGIIYNPRANKGKCEVVFTSMIRPLIEKHFGDRVHKILATEKAGGGYDRAIELASEGCDLIVGCGGDGTLHEIVNGVRNAEDNGQLTLRPVLGGVTLGTSDDFASHIGMIDKTKSYESQYEAIIETLSTSGKVVDIDIGRVEATVISELDGMVYRELDQKKSEYFLNECSVGIGAEVIDSTNKASSIWNKALYNSMQGILKQFTYQNRKIEFTQVAKDDTVSTHTEIAQLIACTNGSTFGNGMKVCPHASIHDGLLSMCSLLNVNIFNILVILPKIFSGSHTSHEKIKIDECKKVSMKGVEEDKDAVVLVEADGEIVGALPCSVEIIPSAFQLIIPDHVNQY